MPTEPTVPGSTGDVEGLGGVESAEGLAFVGAVASPPSQLMSDTMVDRGTRRGEGLAVKTRHVVH